ncbi:lipase/acyltransferase domain-containing protein [Schlesneria paludicola]|uniref:lipase/acyltransferase domain-containing protein n=1 Tax=Schlesneria paludicola TaxID=360056 RepID=UPI00029A88C2|nr:hypothetical protein [Schlesneria paludicola]
MPGRARQLGFVFALLACALTTFGCLSTPQLQNYGNPVVLPADYSSLPSDAVPTPVASSQPAFGPDLDGNSTLLTGSTTIINTSPVSDPNAVTSTARSSSNVPDLTHIYRRTAQSDDRDRNPVIVIPGVLGSRLVDQRSGQVVWGQFGGDSIDPHTPWGARMIALPMSQGQPLSALTDAVKAVGTLDALDVRLLGIPFQINAYRDLLNALGIGGYRDAQTNLANIDYGNQSYNSFQFAYDWRRDNVENARRLHQFILDKKAYVESERRKRYGDDFEPVRFDIVAHSMGGLIARYYLQYGDADLSADQSAAPLTWAGAEHVARLIMIGTPNAGSVDTIANLIQGETLSRFLPRYEAAILGTMPALYQLLPRSRQNPVVAEGDRRGVDIMDPRVWGQFRWGLLDPRQQHIVRELLPEVSDPQERQQIVYDHLSKCLARARAFHAAMDAPAKPPEGTTIHLIAGDAHPTITQYRVDNRGTLTMTAMQPGDGKVSRPSALMDERYSTGTKWTPRLVTPIKWTSVNFLFADHLGLTSDPGFTDNVLFLLLESPR